MRLASEWVTIKVGCCAALECLSVFDSGINMSENLRKGGGVRTGKGIWFGPPDSSVSPYF